MGRAQKNVRRGESGKKMMKGKSMKAPKSTKQKKPANDEPETY